MPAALLVALALARPLEVLEEWEIVSRAPLRESVTARGVYRRSDGPRARLPDAVQGGEVPAVFAPGARRELTVTRGTDGWEVTMPPGERDTVRVVAQLVRPVVGARRFRVAWPAFVPSRTPTRRVANVSRGWVQGEGPADWTCPDTGLEVLTCVSTARAPPALLTAIPLPRTPRPWWVAVVALAIAALVAARFAGPRERARERAVGAVAGLFVGLALGVAIAGAHALSWGAAITVGFALFGPAGALAPRTPRASAAGAITLLAVPLVTVADGRISHVAALAAIGLVATVALSVRAGATRPQP